MCKLVVLTACNLFFIRLCRIRCVAFTPSMYKNILLADKLHFFTNQFICTRCNVLFYSRSNKRFRIQFQRELFLSMSGNRVYSYRETYIWVSQVIGMDLIFLITLQPNEMHHFPHILPPPSLPTKSVNQIIGVYQSHPMQRALPTAPLVHCHPVWPSVITSPPSVT